MTFAWRNIRCGFLSFLWALGGSQVGFAVQTVLGILDYIDCKNNFYMQESTRDLLFAYSRRLGGRFSGTR